jgi:CTP synthase (UTP-ammonia lyase)
LNAVALLGEFDPTFAPHIATATALQHSCDAVGVTLHADWVSTADVDSSLFLRYSAVWVLPGSPYKSLERTIEIIRHAREHQIPCFGTCGGFQHMIIEYARNVLKFTDAQHAEYDPSASGLFISQLACSLAGREMKIRLVEHSRAARIYGTTRVSEEYYCNFGVNPKVVELFRGGPLKISGSDDEGESRVVELDNHPFFVGTLFVPQARSNPARPHPLVNAFVRAASGCPRFESR